MLKTVSSITNAIGALNYKGTWNASTNTPTLTSGSGTKGDYYQVSVAGSTVLDGISNWGVGDVVAFNGATWQRIEGGADLNGVNLSATGIVNFTGATVSNGGSVTTVDINGGTVDNAAVGNSTPAVGKFTTLSVATTSTESPVTAQTTRYSTHTSGGGRQYKLFDMANIGANDTFQDIINITTPGGFASGNYYSGILGVLRVSVVGQQTNFVNQIATKTYVVRTSMQSNGAVSITLTEATDFASAGAGTITVQAKSGATASLATIEAKFASANGTLTADSKIMYSFEGESFGRQAGQMFQTPAVA
jgi:hypothetical protein